MSAPIEELRIYGKIFHPHLFSEAAYRRTALTARNFSKQVGADNALSPMAPFKIPKETRRSPVMGILPVSTEPTTTKSKATAANPAFIRCNPELNLPCSSLISCSVIYSSKRITSLFYVIFFPIKAFSAHFKATHSVVSNKFEHPFVILPCGNENPLCAEA